MKYHQFRIQNFRGIKDTTVKFDSRSGSNIYTFVGLNESGKTTILEAIYSFSPDLDSRHVVNPDKALYKYSSLIPKHLISDFTGDVIITATVGIEREDITLLADYMKKSHAIELHEKSIPRLVTIEKTHTFSASSYVKTINLWNMALEGKQKGKRKIAALSEVDSISAYNFLMSRLPIIAYFPTFIFDFPERIYLSGRESDKTNQFYCRVFQDILDANGERLNIDTHIVSRVRRKDLPANPLEFIAKILGGGSTVKEQIDAVMYKASATVTSTIFGKWNEIFAEKFSNKEIVIDWKPDVDEQGAKNVYIEFFIKDGVNRYAIPDRSLGFRWFFCFLLFTQFRANRNPEHSTIFLFDEPASNLHSRAQEQLINSFPNIASGRNILIYSTHSHYMINPAWLEKTYIVENAAVKYSTGADDFTDKSSITEIRALSYRRFVGENSDKATYFQPILDKLDYKPSALEFRGPSIIVEGKSDFYIIGYFARYIFENEVNIFPSSGANDIGPIIALMLGWGKEFTILLDGDGAGKDSKRKFVEEFYLNDGVIYLLSDVLMESKLNKIENLLDKLDIEIIKTHFELSGAPSKKHIARFFAEIFASGTIYEFSDQLKLRINIVIKKLTEKIPIIFHRMGKVLSILLMSPKYGDVWLVNWNLAPHAARRH